MTRWDKLTNADYRRAKLRFLSKTVGLTWTGTLGYVLWKMSLAALVLALYCAALLAAVCLLVLPLLLVRSAL